MKYKKIGNSKNFIVFLHGWGADKNSFFWLSDYFKNYSLLFVDFAGFGESEEPKTPLSVLDYVLELKNLLNEFDIFSLTLVGHSFGGRVAIKFSFFFENDYEKFGLFLVDSAGILPRRGLKYYYNIYKYKFYKELFKNSKKLNDFGSSDFKALSPVMKETFKLVVNEDLSNYARFIKSKTIIFWGRDDKETKLFMAKKLHKLIKNSKLVVVSGAGHFSFLDKKIEFAITLDSFLKNQ